MSKKQALYPYTLQPVALNMTDDEFHKAQRALFETSSQSVGLNSIHTKEWIILIVIALLAVAGLLFFQGYSTIFFWIMIAGCVAYLLVRTLGLKWYMKREFDKQVAETEIPEQLRQLKLGVQSHGLIMNLPAPNTAMPIQMRGMTMKAAPSQQAVIPWSAVTSWDETDEYVFIMFTLQGQQGSQIIPKRIKELPITTITKHLGETMPKGLRMDTLQTS